MFLRLTLILSVFLPLLAFSSDICVVTMAIGNEYEKAVEKGIENKRQYCKKHGYDFVYMNKILDPKRKVKWSKIGLIQNVMRTNKYKWIFWTDADALIMNMGLKLEGFIDEDYDVIISRDRSRVMNTGNFFIRNCQWSLDFLDDVYTHKHPPPGYPPLCDNLGFVVEYNRKESVQERFQVLPMRELNSYASVPELQYRKWRGRQPKIYKRGDFIIHFVRTAHELDKLSTMTDMFLKQMIDEPEAFDLDHFFDVYSPEIKDKSSIENRPSAYRAAGKTLSSVNTLVEYGFYNGRNLSALLKQYPDAKAHSVGERKDKISQVAQRFFNRRYFDRVKFLKTNDELHRENTKNIDLIFIGELEDQKSYLSLFNEIQKIANGNTRIIVDNSHLDKVQKGLSESETQRVIRVLSKHPVAKGSAAWTEIECIGY